MDTYVPSIPPALSERLIWRDGSFHASEELKGDTLLDALFARCSREMDVAVVPCRWYSPRAFEKNFGVHFMNKEGSINATVLPFSSPTFPRAVGNPPFPRWNNTTPASPNASTCLKASSPSVSTPSRSSARLSPTRAPSSLCACFTTLPQSKGHWNSASKPLVIFRNSNSSSGDSQNVPDFQSSRALPDMASLHSLNTSWRDWPRRTPLETT